MTAPATECARCHTPVPSDARFCLVCGNEVSSPGVPPPRNAVDELRDRLAEVLAGRYVIRRTLGVGGMGAVFLAEETGLEREVAIKVLPPRLAEDPSIVTRFEREAKTAARLDHSHIIPIYRVDSEGGLHYFVMKYVAGRALDTLMADRGQLPVPLTVRILCESAAALEHAHRKGVVHRDIKPANILLDADDRVLLADFGIAKAVSVTGELTNTGVVIGTPYYMSPEQARGVPVDGRSDQYSLAVLGYRMLTGEPLFDGDSSMAILYKHINDPPPRVRDLRPDVPPEVEGAIQRALAKHREDRFPSMEAFARALRGEEPADGPAPAAPLAEATLADGELTSAATVQLDATPVPAGRRRWPWLALAGLLLAAAGTWRWYPRPAPLPAARPPASSTEQAGSAAPTSTPVATPIATAPGKPPAQPRDTATPASEVPSHRRAQAAPKPSSAAPPTAPAPLTARLSVNSTPYGTLYIDDVKIGVVPVFGHVLAAGDHVIKVESERCKTKTEKITVSDPNPIVRRYVLDCGAP